MTQNWWILKHLRQRPLTALDALRLYQCLRLAARIAELRAEGHKIKSNRVTENGKHFVRYTL